MSEKQLMEEEAKHTSLDKLDRQEKPSHYIILRRDG